MKKHRKRQIVGIRTRLFHTLALLSIAMMVLSLALNTILLVNAFQRENSVSFQKTSAQINAMIEMRLSEASQISYLLSTNTDVLRMFSG